MEQAVDGRACCELERVEQAPEVVDRQLDQPCWCWCVIAFARSRDGEKDGEGGPAVPGRPAPDLVLVHAGQAFGGLGWVGRTARCLAGRSFSVQPPAEPDVPGPRP